MGVAAPDHHPESEPRPRCLGRQVPIAQVAALRPDGTEAVVDEVGMLGVRSPSIARGYWNDSDTTYRGRLDGYWLSGDLVRRSADEFFRVDRLVDMIPTASRNGYSLLMEEILLLSTPEAHDCAVVASRRDGAALPVGVVRLGGAGTEAAQLLDRINKSLADTAEPQLAVVEVAAEPADLPVDVTGKAIKRLLREKYADPDAYLADGPAAGLPSQSTEALRYPSR